MVANNKKISIENIPDELKECNQWILWRYDIGKNGRQTKVPYSPKGEKTGAQKARWNIYKMVECVNSGGFSGIGFSFKESDDYIGIDYDAEKDKEGNIIKPLLDDTGEIIDPVIREEVIAINSYTEISPSGAGIHVICRGKKPKEWKTGTKKGQGELYFSGRYFTVTGDKYKNSPSVVNNIDEKILEKLYYRLNPDEKKIETQINKFEKKHIPLFIWYIWYNLNILGG